MAAKRKGPGLSDNFRREKPRRPPGVPLPPTRAPGKPSVADPWFKKPTKQKKG